MSVSLYFGLPGCGKTTKLAQIASSTDKAIEVDKIRKVKGKKPLCPFECVYSNIPLTNIHNYRLIKFDWLGKYHIENGLILIDEATIEADSRDYKSFKQRTKEFILLARHYNCSLVFFTQQWDGIDKKIRIITDRVYYLYKLPIIGKWFTSCYRVPYGIIIPDPKKSDSEKLGEIIQGYCKPNIFVRLLTPPMLRAKYYKYFDSWEKPQLLPLPKNSAFSLYKSHESAQ